MRYAKAPEGFHTSVEVHVRLKNGVSKSFRWSTGMAVMPTYHKAPKWAMQELKELNVKGRSAIAQIEVVARLAPGNFVKGGN